MKPGEIVLLRFPQADLAQGKLRPALIVALAPGRHPDVLLALITSRAYQEILGNISAERLGRIKQRLADWLKPQVPRS